MAKIITLKYPAECADCKARIPAGEKARYYNSRTIYCYGGHKKISIQELDEDFEREDSWRGYREGESLGMTRSRFDKYGVYNHAGERIGRVSCGCEDYPCCGH